MFLAGPGGHVEADLGDEGEGDGGIDALDEGEIDAGGAEEGGAGIEAGGVAVGACLAAGIR